MTHYFILVEHNGFIMDFQKSGATLKYTVDLETAQKFDRMSQARQLIKTLGLSSDFCKIMEVSHDSRW